MKTLPPEPSDVPESVLDDTLAEELASADQALPGSSALVRHPDGYYWVAPDGHQEFGPFDTAEEALADMDDAGEESLEPGETVQQVEDELGISDWIDPDTGEPAEQTRAHIEDR